MEEPLHEQLRFRRPFLEVDSRAAHLEGPAADPPEPAEFAVLHRSEARDAMALFNDHRKAGPSAVIAQLCRFREGRIAELLLVLDARALT